ncbi:hypothetical protein INT43_005530 [Umbelopsis isabellina]|uniref:protein O-GlcNAc transferase n=1 Tax=Mortierella isabellina TaxID=91625 RepID=A0A8H7PN99_MORIS|nr:hypothetical protein INT43_005530 [Umbelopsis isabellina]
MRRQEAEDSRREEEVINSVSDLNVAGDETWKERKDPFSTKGPTSTLVDFETIAPPPPSKRFVSDDLYRIQPVASQSKNYMDTARSSSSRYGQALPEAPHPLSSLSYGTGPSHQSYQPAMASSTSSLPMSSDNQFNQPRQSTYPPAFQYQQAMQQQQPFTQQQLYHPSIMVPPQSPTLASYYFEGSNTWLDQYKDPKRMRSPSAHVDTDYMRMMQQRQQWHSMNAAAANLMVGHGFADAQAMQQWLLQQQQSYQINPQATVPSMYHFAASNPLALNGQHLHTMQHQVQQHQQQALLLQHLYSQQQQQQQQIMSTMGLAASQTLPNTGAHYSENMQRRAHPHRQSGSISRTPTFIASTSQPAQYTASIPSVAQMLQTGAIDSSETSRDQLLAYAHGLYASSPYNQTLVELLHLLNSMHPTHLPTLLLLACVYFTQRNHQASLHYNQLILKQDPQYVEAMSNIGTTLRSMGRTGEAEQWWYQAVKLRPGYWDAVENLVGVLCSSQATSDHNKKELVSTNHAGHDDGKAARYREALNVCDFVEQFFFKSASHDTGYKATTIGRFESAIKPPKDLPTHQIPRLQNLFYAKGNLKYALGDMIGARIEYEKGLEIIFGGRSMLEIVNTVICAVGQTRVNETVRQGTLVDSDSLPLVLLRPEQVTRLLELAFPETHGVLPGLVSVNNRTTTTADSASVGNQQAAQTTSTILLTLAKMFQDMMNPSSSASPKAAAAAATDRTSTKPTMAILLPLYYLSLSINPSPSTANNLGIILSNISGATIASAVFLHDNLQQQGSVNGSSLALQYYTYGLQLDPRHPHLYTNLGSLLKDLGHLNEAVRMYEKAVECNPRFDVALANLGNAVKDMGRVQDSVQWYKRAVEVNANFVDAICGLVNSLGGICDWRGRGTVGNEHGVDQVGRFIPSIGDSKTCTGWIGRVVEIVDKQLNEGLIWGAGVLRLKQENGLHYLENLVDSAVRSVDHADATSKTLAKKILMKKALSSLSNSTTNKMNEGGWIIRLIERTMRRTQRSWYIAHFGPIVDVQVTNALAPILVSSNTAQKYKRPMIPAALPTPPVPTVLPFHTFTYPLSSRQIRLISHRNALRISHGTLSSSWVPAHVYPPPPPPAPRIKLGYLSSDFNNHPLAHLMQSVFGFHDKKRFEVFCYATTASDGSNYRSKIDSETEHFIDVSTWNNQQIVERLHADGIHILINLNGYTKGARNEIVAARPCPVQCSFMGFAGTLAGGWCDWIIADPIVCPPETVSCEQWRYRRSKGGSENHSDFSGDIDPECSADSFVYTEKFIYMPHSYFVNDHKQGFREEGENQSVQIDNIPDTKTWELEESKRWKMRREVFPDLPDDVIIFANFNQLYKLEPGTFRLWLRILERVPNSIIWLLRFPPAGEANLLRTAMEWCGPEVAQRVVFTDVAPKHIHIHRGRVADLFLDTPECNAHTTAADILWSGTPILTWPKYMHKMCSRVGASIARATGFGDEMIVSSEKEYEDKAVALANSLKYNYTSVNGEMQRLGKGTLHDLRKRLYTTRERNRLFDTLRWTRNLETGYIEAWRRWVTGEEFEDINGNLDQSGCIWVQDPDDAKLEM